MEHAAISALRVWAQNQQSPLGRREPWTQRCSPASPSLQLKPGCSCVYRKNRRRNPNPNADLCVAATGNQVCKHTLLETLDTHAGVGVCPPPSLICRCKRQRLGGLFTRADAKSALLFRCLFV